MQKLTREDMDPSLHRCDVDSETRVFDLWAVNDVGVKAISGVRVEQCGECRPSLTVVRRGLSRGLVS